MNFIQLAFYMILMHWPDKWPPTNDIKFIAKIKHEMIPYWLDKANSYTNK